MGDFRVDERDALFTLFEYLQIDELLALPRYAEAYDADTLRMVVVEAAKFMTEQVAPTNEQGDVQGARRLEDGTVKFPDSFYELYPKFVEAGWWAPIRDMEYGGMGLPGPVAFACHEFIDSASPAWGLVPMLTNGCANLIASFGTEEQKAAYVEKMFTGVWGGTMCLTEPHAGTNVGALTTKAIPEGDHFLIEGTKIFITNAEHDLTENIVHAVLARVEGDPPGTRGISLFLVPKFRLDDAGDPGEFNHIRCANIEEKMGIHGSPTCLMNFGDGGPTVGYLLGEQGKGMSCMFQMMNEARIETGMNGLAIAAAAYHYALDYSRERGQGKATIGDNPADGSQAPITSHPDVRRMLMECKALCEGMRALMYFTAHEQDLSLYHPDREAAQPHTDLVDALVPLCKAFCTDMGLRVTEQAMQCMGGYGYCAEYRVEQYMRDAKIFAIVEGTNGVQALDLVGRKMRIRDGAPARAVIGRIGLGVERIAAEERLAELGQRLGKANADLVEVVGTLAKKGAGDMLYPLINATPFLELLSRVFVGMLLGEQALVARTRLDELEAAESCDTDEEKAALLGRNDQAVFYHNKVQTALFYARRLLVKNVALKEEILADDRSLLEVVL